MYTSRRFAAVLLSLLAGCHADPLDATAVEQAQTVVQPESQPRDAKIGDSWDSATQTLGPACVDVEIDDQILGQTSGQILVDRSDDASGVEKELGFELKAKGRYLIASASVAAKLSQAMKEDHYSRVFIYSAEFKTGTRSRKRVTRVNHGPLDWQRDCGDEMVDQIKYGGRFYYLYRIDFVSAEARSSFEAELQAEIQKGLASAELQSKLKEVGRKYSRRGKVHVEAYQFGGNPALLGQVITGPTVSNNSAYAVLDCDLTNVDACNAVLKNALDYTNPKVAGSFADQLEQGRKAGQLGAPIQYLTEAWNKVQDGLGSTPVVITTQIEGARQMLSDKFERIMRAWVRINRMRSRFGSLPKEQKDSLDDWSKRLDGSLANVDLAVKACYDNLRFPGGQIDPGSVSACVTAVSGVDDSEPPADLLIAFGRYAIDAKHASLKAGGFDLGEGLRTRLCYYDIRTHQQKCELGLPREAETTGKDGIGLQRRFSGGSIYWSADTDAFELHGDILYKYGYLGEANSSLGFPLTDELVAPDGRFNLFQNGAIYWNKPDRDTRAVQGDIYLKWSATDGNPNPLARRPWLGPLGRPISDEQTAADGVSRYSLFQNGAIYWREDGQKLDAQSFDRKARIVRGAIFTGWNDNAREAGVFGFPITDTLDGGNGGLEQQFQYGDIYWHWWFGAAKGSLGMIGAKYRAMNGPRSPLGYPMDDMQKAFDGVTDYQQFETGRIYYKPQLGAHAVYGPIFARYRDQNFESGRFGRYGYNLGYPMTDVESFNGGERVQFEGGWIVSGPNTGAHLVGGPILQTYGTHTTSCGLPTDDETLHPAQGFNGEYWRQNFEHGWMEVRSGTEVSWECTNL